MAMLKANSFFHIFYYLLTSLINEITNRRLGLLAINIDAFFFGVID